MVVSAVRFFVFAKPKTENNIATTYTHTNRNRVNHSPEISNFSACYVRLRLSTIELIYTARSNYACQLWWNVFPRVNLRGIEHSRRGSRVQSITHGKTFETETLECQLRPEERRVKDWTVCIPKNWHKWCKPKLAASLRPPRHVGWLFSFLHAKWGALLRWKKADLPITHAGQTTKRIDGGL